MALLAVQDVAVRYGAIQAVDMASLEVAAGEIVTLLGANGAGKSSLLNACMGLVPLAGGQVQRVGHGPDGDVVEVRDVRVLQLVERQFGGGADVRPRVLHGGVVVDGEHRREVLRHDAGVLEVVVGP